MGNLLCCSSKNTGDVADDANGFSEYRKTAHSEVGGKYTEVETAHKIYPVKENGDFYLLCEESGNRVKEMMGTILDQYTEIKDLNPINVSDMRQIRDTTDLPILLPCIYASRLGTDIQALYRKVGVTAQRKVLLVIFHHFKANTYSVTSSSLVLDSTYKHPAKDIMDVIYQGNGQIVKCQHNDQEMAKLIKNLGLKVRKDNINHSLRKQRNTNVNEKNILGNNKIMKAQVQENTAGTTSVPKTLSREKENVVNKESEKATRDMLKNASVENNIKSESSNGDSMKLLKIGEIEAETEMIENDTDECTSNENATDKNEVDKKAPNINTESKSTTDSSTSEADAAVKNGVDKKISKLNSPDDNNTEDMKPPNVTDKIGKEEKHPQGISKEKGTSNVNGDTGYSSNLNTSHESDSDKNGKEKKIPKVTPTNKDISNVNAGGENTSNLNTSNENTSSSTSTGKTSLTAEVPKTKTHL